MLTVIYQPRAGMTAKERSAVEFSYYSWEAWARSEAARGRTNIARSYARRARGLIAAYGVRIRPRVVIERKAVPC